MVFRNIRDYLFDNKMVNNSVAAQGNNCLMNFSRTRIAQENVLKYRRILKLIVGPRIQIELDSNPKLLDSSDDQESKSAQTKPLQSAKSNTPPRTGSVQNHP
jgi:hypothetical protein